jgi:hypothetical protein
MFPLSRPLIQFSLISTVILTLAIVVIHSRPYGDLSLPTASDSCALPCFMGIQPDVTRMSEAIALLENHEWVSQVSITSYNKVELDQIAWTWLENAPLILQAHEHRIAGRIFAEQGVVRNIEFRTRIPLGDLWLEWGLPEIYTTLAQTSGPALAPQPPKPITLIYADKIVIAGKDCPYLHNFWEGKTSIIVGDPSSWLKRVIPRPYVPVTTSLRAYVRDLSRNDCFA